MWCGWMSLSVSARAPSSPASCPISTASCCFLALTAPASEAPRLLLLVNPTGMSHQNWHSLDNQALTTHAFPLDTPTPHPARRQGPSLGGGEAQRRGPKGQGGPCSWWEQGLFELAILGSTSELEFRRSEFGKSSIKVRSK